MDRTTNRRRMAAIIGAAAVALAELRGAAASPNRGCGEGCQHGGQCGSGLCCAGRCLCCNARRNARCANGGGFCCRRGKCERKV